MNNIQQMILNHLNNTVHGSGFDCDWKPYTLSGDKAISQSGRLSVFGGYHNMNEHGYYDGWTDLILYIPLMNPDIIGNLNTVLSRSATTPRGPMH